ncbi:hypothetical protein GKE82_20380 [Conexibacter sp. W3-3-2]|uniref:Uncharacterized protein n=1 Tax=Paraconexibacter algicola TaxID=2133960 RepID=A0A2T4ULV7_9ACTN|nr:MULTISPECIES: hypothetical protein [Solirubrobacterales]MTD46581.1 hypothetical protein [Conexibacter sp. W3-3-2]PTL60219.1 hypothetical protein C7Y72_11510 [Paraconexibacter algicola]
MITDSTRRIGAGALIATGVLHLVLAPEYLGEQAYIGVLFILGGLTAAAIGARLWTRDDASAWIAGALVAVGMAVGFVLSRTVGLPGFHESEWELSGLISVVLELGVAGIAAAALRAPRHHGAVTA